MSGMVHSRILRRFPWRVRRVVLQAQEKGLRARAADDLHRFVREQIGEIAGPIDRGQVQPEVGRAVRRAQGAPSIGRSVREIVRSTAEHSEKLVEAMPVRAEFRLPAQVPLADQ
jgi:hypothetical protein